MDATCKFECCEHEGENESEKAIVVRFSNGKPKKMDTLDFTCYKSAEETNPRKKSRRMLVAESSRLSYVGSNFGTGSLKCNNLCKYYVGVLNKQTMQMEVHSAQLFSMRPVIPGEIAEVHTPMNTTQSFREKVDSLIETFGTNKQKRALSSRKLNQVGRESLQKAMAQAANTVIDQKGLEVLQQEVVEMESQSDIALYLPPCNPDANTPEDVYPFDDLLTPVEYDALGVAGSKMAALTPEELQKLRDEGCLSVVKLLENLPSGDEAREKQMRCTYYLSLLFKLARLRSVNRKFGEEEGCPRIILSKLTKTFTVETFKNGGVKYTVSSSMRIKVGAYCLALLLHIGHMTADLTLLHRDLGVPEARMIQVAKSMGLTLSRPSKEKTVEIPQTDDHRLASLVLPLVKYESFSEGRKRKKMR